MSILMVCCRCLFTFLKKYRSQVVIKFHESTYGRGKEALGFWADWIGTLVAMAHGQLKAPRDIKKIKGE